MVGALLSMFGGGKDVGNAVKGIGEGIGALAIGIRTAITGKDPIADAALERFVVEAEALATQGQQAINKVEAAHKSIFVAGWRPAIGWVCAISLAAYFIPKYVMAAILWTRASWSAQEILAYPVGIEGLTELVIAMLGLGLYRTYEKSKNADNNH